MIARIWQGITLTSKAESYLQYLNQAVIPACQRAAGLQGLIVMRETRDGLTHFLLLSLWATEEALRDFTGAEPDVVSPPPQEKDLLTAFESTARHYAVLCASVPLPKL